MDECRRGSHDFRYLSPAASTRVVVCLGFIELEHRLQCKKTYTTYRVTSPRSITVTEHRTCAQYSPNHYRHPSTCSPSAPLPCKPHPARCHSRRPPLCLVGQGASVAGSVHERTPPGRLGHCNKGLDVRVDYEAGVKGALTCGGSVVH